MLVDVFLPIDSQVFIFSVKDSRIVVDEVYNVDHGLEQLINNLGGWDQKTGLVLNPLPIYERRKDFQGYQINAETMPNPPFVIANISDLELEIEKQVGGILGEIWHDNLEKTMNFTTLVKPSPDRQWGHLSNGSWTGMVNGIIKERTTVGLGFFYFHYERGIVVDFSPTIIKDEVRMLIKNPKHVVSWTTYVKPFNIYLWICTLVLLFLIVTALAMTYIIGPEKDLNPGSFNLPNSFTIVIGSQAGQGSWLDPKTLSTRIVFLTSFLFAVILITSFSANLVAFSTVTPLPFTGLENIKRSGYSVGAVQDWFEDVILHNLLYPNTDIITPVDSIEAGLNKARKEKYAFTCRSFYFKENKDCDFISIPGVIASFHQSIIWSKNWPHRHFFGYFLNKMKETGQIDRIVQKWLGKAESDCKVVEKSTGIESTVSGFALLLLGLIISTIMLLIEILVSCKINAGADNSGEKVKVNRLDN